MRNLLVGTIETPEDFKKAIARVSSLIEMVTDSGLHSVFTDGMLTELECYHTTYKRLTEEAKAKFGKDFVQVH